jgi:hypothetical protein
MMYLWTQDAKRCGWQKMEYRNGVQAGTRSFKPISGQGPRNTRTVLGKVDGQDVQQTRSRNGSGGIKPAGTSAWRNLHIQYLSPRPSGGSSEGLQCYRLGSELTRGSILAQSEPVTVVTEPHVGRPQAQDPSSKVDDVIETAKQRLTNEEFQELLELLA